MRRIACLLLCLSLLLVQVSAARPKSLEETLSQFISENGLTEENFSVSYFNAGAEEEYQYNETGFFPAGQVWKLPLHMYYCQQESLGAYDPPADNPKFVYTIEGKTLEECRVESILRDNDEVTEHMRRTVGSMSQFQNTVNDRFGRAADPPAEFLTGTWYSAEFLMNCLKELSRNSDVYGELMRNFAMVETSDAFNGYTRPYAVTQIRGEEDGMICAVAEVSAPSPYLIAAFASEEAGGDQLLADLNTLICTYVEEQAGVDEKSTPARTADNRRDSDLQVAAAEKEPVGQWIGIALGGAAALALLIGLIVWLCRHFSGKREE